MNRPSPNPSSIVTRVLSLVGLACCVSAQNLIPNPGFESGLGPLCTSNPTGQQGLLPSPWLQVGFPRDGADAYSSNCLILPGMDSTWNNFVPFEAHSGVRWAAGWNATTPHEGFGCQLLAPLLPNTRYLLGGFFFPSTRAQQTGRDGYDCSLAATPSVGSGTLIATRLGAGTPAGGWTEQSVVFQTGPVVPSPCYLLMDPAASTLPETSYVGVDDLVLVALGGFYSYYQSNLPVPALSGSGSVTPGTSFTVDLTGAPALQLGLFVGGLAPIATPLLGSLLVVDPIVVTLFTTNSAGAANMPVNWPVGIPPGTRAFFQAFVVDPAGSFVASPGLAAVGS